MVRGRIHLRDPQRALEHLLDHVVVPELRAEDAQRNILEFEAVFNA
ncbi:Uncharacterised protein [Mycobacterium tuberculosis]|nr:Uncharacterised protein [Mycobacterium tuberculosis]